MKLLSKFQRPIGCLVLGSIALYVFSLLYAGALTPDYRHTQNLISELGQVGAPYSTLWRSTIAIAGTLVILMSVTLHQIVDGNRSRLGPILVATVGAGLILGGVFQCDPTCAPKTFTGWMHILTSIPATLAALAGPFVFARRLDGDPAWRRYSRACRIFGGLSLIFILAAVAVFPYCGIPGIGQRLATLMQMAWFSMMAGALVFRRDAAWPPGPSGIQALRYLGWRRDLIGFTERCSREYGGICGIRLFGTRFCLISDPLLIERVLVTHASRVKKWDTGKLFDLILGQGLLTSHGELWKRQRALIQPVFQPGRLGDYTAPILRHAGETLGAWRSGEVVDLHQEMLRLSLKIAATALFGADSSSVEGLIAEVQDLLMKQFEDAVSGIPVPLTVPTPRNLRVRRAIRQLDEVVFRLITERKAGQPQRDFLGALLAAQEDGVGPAASPPMSDRQLRDECMTMLLAGHETTALVLTWALWLIAQDPALGRELAEEVDRVLGSGPVTEASAGELPHLRNVVSESMRLYPVVWASGRVNLEPIDLGPYVLPAGTQIFIVPFLAHRDGKVFADPLEFRPKRWDDPALRTIPRCSYMPFGSGPRKCVGMNFAVRETMLILASLLRRFRLESVPGETVALQASVTLRPANGARVRLVGR